MRTSPTLVIGAVAVMLGIVALIATAMWSEYANETTRTCTVTDKDRTTVTTSDNTRSDMRVYTEQCGTMQAGDLLLRGQFDSSDIYSSIQTGHTYQVTTVGWRVPFLSVFPTILGTPTEATQ